eukprot:COSAG01_NODE_37_length_34085_cov_64.376626_6_plen_139_part_00
MSLWVIKKRRMHRDALLCYRGRPRHWIQTGRELSGSAYPQNSQPTPVSPIFHLLPPLAEGCGKALDLRPQPFLFIAESQLMPHRGRSICSVTQSALDPQKVPSRTLQLMECAGAASWTVAAAQRPLPLLTDLVYYSAG